MKREIDPTFTRSLKTVEELDQFFNISLDLLCIANTDGYFLRLNPAWERILGYTREELMTKRFLDFVHPDDLDSTRKTIGTLASQHQVTFLKTATSAETGRIVGCNGVQPPLET